MGVVEMGNRYYAAAMRCKIGGVVVTKCSLRSTGKKVHGLNWDKFLISSHYFCKKAASLKVVFFGGSISYETNNLGIHKRALLVQI